ncbi:MAG: hypothetical protein V2A71_10495 [Candidatus Eisenbacteria bacterium]
MKTRRNVHRGVLMEAERIRVNPKDRTPSVWIWVAMIGTDLYTARNREELKRRIDNALDRRKEGEG